MAELRQHVVTAFNHLEKALLVLQERLDAGLEMVAQSLRHQGNGLAGFLGYSGP